MIVVVAVALLRGDGLILMQKRRADRQHGGLWEFPGGKVEQGEVPAAAALREMAEELAVTIPPAALEPVGFAERVGEGPPLVILLYLCREWSGDPQCLDAEMIDWVAPDAIPALAMPPLDYPLAAALQRHLG